MVMVAQQHSPWDRGCSYRANTMVMDTSKRRICILKVAIIADRNSSAPSIYDEFAQKLSLSVDLALVTYERDIL